MNINPKAQAKLSDGEVRCPACGKLILKGVFARGTKVIVRCRERTCRYKAEDLIIEFK